MNKRTQLDLLENLVHNQIIDNEHLHQTKTHNHLKLK